MIKRTIFGALLRRPALRLALSLTLTGGAAHAAFIVPASPACDPTKQTCVVTPPPGGPGQCGPGLGGATCAAPGPAAQGSGPGINVGAGNPINVITGNKYQRETDMPALPGVLGLEIVRHYNSVFSSPTHSNGIVGRGWKLSYETDLYAVNRTIQIVQADGTRLIFSRDQKDPSQCASANPADGTVRITKTGRGDEYTWTWTNGRQLNFNTQGKLLQILAPTGEFVSMQHDRKGILLQVTDPQGRSLRLHYLDGKRALAGDAFRGVQNIDSPVGRFTYAYGSAMPKGGGVGKIALAANLVKVGLPNGGDGTQESPANTERVISGGISSGTGGTVHRIYHYEDARHPTLLTGISITGSGSDGKLVNQRVSTFGYDINGKGILTVKGAPARLQTGPDGKALVPAVLVAGTGIEQVTLDTSVGGRTVVTNSLGQETVYRHAIVGGEFRLLEVRGAGCASCGEPNVRYGYDKLGRLTDTTRLTRDGQPIEGTRTDLDVAGRAVKVSRIGYQNGKAGAGQWLVRYEYAGGSAATPTLIARPSVVPGQEYVTRITYGNSAATRALPVQITESGYAPTLDGKGIAEAIKRSIGYRYNGYGQRIETDGPLPNAQDRPGPANSDITRTEYDPKTKLLVKTIAPGNIVTEVLERDDALRPSKVRTSDGATVQTATIRSNWRGQPDQITIEAASVRDGAPDHSGTMQIEPATKLTRNLRYRYDAQGNLTSVTQPGNLTTTFGYDSAGRLTHRILPDGSRVVMQQDTEGRRQSAALYWDKAAGSDVVLDQVKVKAIASTHYHYDDANRLTRIDDAEGLHSRVQYTELGQIARLTNALGTAAQFDYDANGLLTTRTQAANSPDAASIKLGYDSHGQPTTITDANGVATERRYDDFGRKMVEVNPDRGVTLYRYDVAGRLIARIDETQSTTRYTYDHANRLIALGADQEPNLVQYRYRGQQLVEVVSTTDGKPEHATERTEYRIDGLGQVTQERRWIARVAAQLDGAALVNVAASGPAAKVGVPGVPGVTLAGLTFTTSSRYDEAGRLVQQALPDGHRLQYRYTPADDRGNTANTTQRGKTGQLNAILFDDSVIVTDIEQSVAGGLSGYTTSNGIRTTIKLDGRGRITQLQAATQASQPAQRGVAGWWAQARAWFGAKDAASATVIYSQANRYDRAGRLSAIERKRATPASVAAPAMGTEQYGYDELDRLIRMDAVDGTITTLGYDKGGNRLAESVTPASASLSRKAATSTAPEVTGATERSYRYASGTNRLIALSNQSDGPPAGAAAILNVGAPKTAAQAARLIQAAWIYHPTGVPLAQFDFARAGDGIAHAATQNNSRRIVYNSAKRPIAVFGADHQAIARYYYNGQGERIAKTVYPVGTGNVKRAATAQPDTRGRTTYSLYREQRLAAETDENGHITAHYLYLYGKPVAKIDMAPNANFAHTLWKAVATLGGLLEQGDIDASDSQASIYAIHTDHLGTPQAVTDAQQRLVWQAETTPFGQANVRYASSTTTTRTPFQMNLRLPGQMYDAETGLNQNYYRDYNPQLGRYTTPDPIGIEGGMNPYSYVSNNPLINADPLGLYEEDVHYYATYFLALTAGLSAKQAWVVATGDRYIDDNPNTEPYGQSGTNKLARLYYHFTQNGWDPKQDSGETAEAYAARRYLNSDNPQIQLLRGDALFSENTNCAKTQLYGEFLHAFQDTFAHRDKENNPYASAVGHLSGGHNPDKTFSHVIDFSDVSAQVPITSLGSWQYNGARTIAMEEETFNLLQKDFGVTAKNKNGSEIKWVDIKSILSTFNQNDVAGLREITAAEASNKAAVLQSKLNQLGLGVMKSYSCTDGRDQRNKNLVDKDGKPLDQGRLFGIILATPTSSEPCK
jgi:RHS repeat-associated protein